MIGSMTISEMMWHEKHCIYRTGSGRCKLDGKGCPWKDRPDSMVDWYPCFHAEGRE